MATLNLRKVFVNLLATGAAVSGQSAPGRGEEYETPGEVRTYAGGRRRAITSAGELGTYSVTLLLLSRAQVETLRAWMGEAVQVRDHKGRRFVGVYHKVSIVEVRSRQQWHVSFELDAITAVEGV